jgi:transcriptional regulator with XRE-family HTH domain
MALCDRIKEVRTDKDLGQKEVAAALGISQQQYSLYETGRRRIPGEMLGPLCLTLGVSADYLLGLPKNLSWPR